ncbi:MAG: sodium-translocating pyrophosphatase [Puniceicoccales bacterium]|jgi:K(+)-stimulated pyrophosphate-energized sodium pump|nr:sodium-translocating pyrophosphatase [Puniceicoccales bacterium]
MIPGYFWLIPLSAMFVLHMAARFFGMMKNEPAGTERMVEIATYVRNGALAYLKQQYKIVAIVFVFVAILLAIMAYKFHLQNSWVPFAFITAGFCSGLAGFIGMQTATQASSRTAFAASQSLNQGLRIAFRSGAVMGLSVVGLALLDYSFWFVILNLFEDALSPNDRMIVITETMLTFAMGTSLQALFARVGGGIFTKAADVGADLVGKVEENIPEDDPRNPATIADNVGDNVGDVAGMGADLYESYYGAILAAAALGASAFATSNSDLQMKAILAPLLIGAAGAILSVLGIFFVKTKENASNLELLRSLGYGIKFSGLCILLASLAIFYLLDIPDMLWRLWGAVAIGLISGEIIGKSSEYYTSQAYSSTRYVAEQAKTGPATVIIGGMGVGMLSTAIPVLAIVTGTLLAFSLVQNFGGEKNIIMGLYGVSIAAVGMLSTLGITMATDAYGPIADNAGGNAEMCGLGEEVRKRTDALDALGNTTAATGKGFAIGSAALTTLALLASYMSAIKGSMLNTGKRSIMLNGNNIPVESLTLADIINYFQIHLLNPKVLMGLFIGAMLSFVFCGLSINAVGRAAASMVKEVRRQFREITGIMENKAVPDYAQCVKISTFSAQREMLIPSLVAILSPILVGVILGVSGVIGLLGGALSTGFVLAIFMANSGGAWDNAKKYIEEGAMGGKGSNAHKAAVIGDTVGDPFKDTAGPSLNILIKLMAMVSVVVVGITVSYS